MSVKPRPQARQSSQVARADGALPGARTQPLRGGEGEGGPTADEPDIIEPGGQPGLQPDVAYSEEFVILNLVKPNYPEYELSQRIAAHITIVVLVTPEGSVGDAQIENVKVEPLGASSRGFELTALEAVRHWRIRLPARYRQTEGCWLRIPIEFRPEDATFTKQPVLAPR